MTTAERYHDISCGHRVYGHESKCAHLHGHNYRVHFVVSGELDSLGRVMDPNGVVFTMFNPTAENIAKHLVEVIAPEQFSGVEETRKCSATYYLPVHESYGEKVLRSFRAK